MDVAVSMRVWLHGRTDRRCAHAAHARPLADVLRPMCERAVRVRLGAHASAPTHASAFRRRGPRAAWRAGVPECVGVQRGHRRVEHRVGHQLGERMRRLFGPGGAPPPAGHARRVAYAARAVVRGGTADARARVCAQTCGHAHARVSTRKGIAASSKDGISVCMPMYGYICVCLCIIHTHIYIGICVLV
jgi:hypothetical protein